MQAPDPLRIALIALALRESDVPRTSADEFAVASRTTRLAAAVAAVERARTTGVHIALFSGWTAVGSFAEPLTVPLVRVLFEAGIDGVLEIVDDGASDGKVPSKVVHSGLPVDDRERSPHRAYFFIDAVRREAVRLTEQALWTSYMADRADGRRRLRRLGEDLTLGGNRRRVVRGHELAILICGENNYFFENRGGRPRLRWRDLPTWEDHSICFNPKHTVVIRPEVTHRLARLSLQDRTALACANFRPSQRHDARVLHVARDGRIEMDNRVDRVIDGEGHRMVLVDAGRRVQRGE